MTDDERWQHFYDDRERRCPFFVQHADENLVEWLQRGLLKPGRALDIGCGNGRNAVCLAQHGFEVTAVDLSAAAIDWAREQAAQAGVTLQLQHGSVFDLALPAAGFDLIYDSGCFHHIAPHRRARYIRLVAEALAPGGAFGLVCFTPAGGSGFSDTEAEQRGSLGGGLGYGEARLRELWSGPLTIAELRPMQVMEATCDRFGVPGLWVMRAQARAA